MTRQEIYTKVRKHLLRQNRKAETPTGGCRYRIGNGRNPLRCAVGCLIPKRLYNRKMENCSVPTGQDLMPEQKVLVGVLKKLKITRRNFGFLRELQSIHDNNYPWSWRGLLDGFAVKHNLTV